MVFSLSARANHDSSHFGIGWFPLAHRVTDAFDTPVSLLRSDLVSSRVPREVRSSFLSIVTPCAYLVGISGINILTM